MSRYEKIPCPSGTATHLKSQITAGRERKLKETYFETKSLYNLAELCYMLGDLLIRGLNIMINIFEHINYNYIR